VREVKGDIWRYKDQGYIVIPTNGYVRNDGRCVMGRGVAHQAARRYPPIPMELGTLIRKHGNHVYAIGINMFSFPVKHVWWEKAEEGLITNSMIELRDLADTMPGARFYLPRVGCGNGQLKWGDVKPILEIGLADNRFTIVNLGG